MLGPVWVVSDDFQKNQTFPSAHFFAYGNGKQGNLNGKELEAETGSQCKDEDDIVQQFSAFDAKIRFGSVNKYQQFMEGS